MHYNHLLIFGNYTNTNYNVCKIGAKHFVCIGHKTATFFGPATLTALCAKKSAILPRLPPPGKKVKLRHWGNCLF